MRGQLIQQQEENASSSAALVQMQQEKSVLEASFKEKERGWQEATSELAVVEAEGESLRQELDTAKLETKRLQETFDQMASEVRGLVVSGFGPCNCLAATLPPSCSQKGEVHVCAQCLASNIVQPLQIIDRVTKSIIQILNT